MNQEEQLEEKVKELSRKVFDLQWNNYLRSQGQLSKDKHPQTWEEAVEQAKVLFIENWNCLYEIFKLRKNNPIGYMDSILEEASASNIRLHFYVDPSQELPKEPENT
jgi:hypothetical protein